MLLYGTLCPLGAEEVPELELEVSITDLDDVRSKAFACCASAARPDLEAPVIALLGRVDEEGTTGPPEPLLLAPAVAEVLSEVD